MEITKPLRSIILTLVIIWTIFFCYRGWNELLSVMGVTERDIWESISTLDHSSKAWFIIHPLLAILGTVALPVPAVILRRYKGYWSKKIHAYFFIVATSSVCLSMYVIYVHKNAKGKQHFQTSHSLYGATLLAAYLLFSLVGSVALDPDWSLISNETVIDYMKWGHKFAGRIFIAVGFWVCLSGWKYKFEKDEKNMWNATVVVSLATFLVFMDKAIELGWGKKKDKEKKAH